MIVAGRGAGDSDVDHVAGVGRPVARGKNAGPLRSSPATGAHNETKAVWIVLAAGPVTRVIVSRQ